MTSPNNHQRRAEVSERERTELNLVNCDTNERGELVMSEIANKERVRRFTVWSCPECGEQIVGRMLTPDQERGHYHDPPEGWHSDDDASPHEDPWFDAVEIEAVSLPDLKNLLTELADRFDSQAKSRATSMADPELDNDQWNALVGAKLAYEAAASELRHLITEQLGSEGENE
jgi:predicted RNA-binding Zn-ribbon protein involved in translation (DUF1610 family)